jgi:hypothetical protein
MINVICSVKDRAADAYGRPLFVPSVGLAIRSFTDEVNREAADNQMHNHPDDFDLYELGTFDDNTGIIECHATPKQLALGKQVKV